MLANGGQLFCGYVGGNFVSDKSYVPYRQRCHVFVFPSDATKFDHHDQEIIGPMNADKEPYTPASRRLAIPNVVRRRSHIEKRALQELLHVARSVRHGEHGNRP